MNERQLARALGWFSVGLGLAELLAPRRVGKASGLANHRTLLRLYGARELAAGVGILTQKNTAPWLWARVAGDALDLATLGIALTSDEQRGRVAFATAAVAGVTALDVLCAQETSRKQQDGHPRRSFVNRATDVTCSITINRPAAQLYEFWRNFENLPRVMEHLKAVLTADAKRSHWTAAGPGNSCIEWDAEVVEDKPNEMISWRSLPGAQVESAGRVRFERAPGGRGTIVRVELRYRPPGGAIGATLAKIFGEAPEQQVPNDLRRFKQLMETGEIATTKGRSAGRPSSISRRYDRVVKDLAAA